MAEAIDFIEDIGTVAYYPNTGGPSISDLEQIESWQTNSAAEPPNCAENLQNDTHRTSISVIMQGAVTEDSSYQTGVGDGTIYRGPSSSELSNYIWAKETGAINFPVTLSLTSGRLPTSNLSVSPGTISYMGLTSSVIYRIYRQHPENTGGVEQPFDPVPYYTGVSAVYFQILNNSGTILVSRLVSYNANPTVPQPISYDPFDGSPIYDWGVDEFGLPVPIKTPPVSNYELKPNVGSDNDLLYYLFLACTNSSYKTRVRIENPDSYSGGYYPAWNSIGPFYRFYGIRLSFSYYYYHGTYVCTYPYVYLTANTTYNITHANNIGVSKYLPLQPNTVASLVVTNGFQPYPADGTQMTMQGYTIQRRSYTYSTGTWSSWTSSWVDSNVVVTVTNGEAQYVYVPRSNEQGTTYSIGNTPNSLGVYSSISFPTQTIRYDNIQMATDDFDTIYQYRAKTIAATTAPPSTWLSSKFISPGQTANQAAVLYTKPSSRDSGWSPTVSVKRCSEMTIAYDKSYTEYGLSFYLRGIHSSVLSGVANPSATNLSAYVIFKSSAADYKLVRCNYAMDYEGKWHLYVAREVFNAMNLASTTMFNVYLCARYGHTGSGLISCGRFRYRPTTNTIQYYANGAWVKCGVFYYYQGDFVPCVPHYYGEDGQWHEIDAGMS